MINLTRDELVPLTDAPTLLPTRERGRRIHKSTVFRWAGRGVKGVVLETVAIGGRRYTSRQALGRFVAGLSGHGKPTT